ncbi:MAG: hypothetical protein WDW36_006281 [Sanguina aurantia]
MEALVLCASLDDGGGDAPDISSMIRSALNSLTARLGGCTEQLQQLQSQYGGCNSQQQLHTPSCSPVPVLVLTAPDSHHSTQSSREPISSLNQSPGLTLQQAAASQQPSTAFDALWPMRASAHAAEQSTLQNSSTFVQSHAAATQAATTTQSGHSSPPLTSSSQHSPSPPSCAIPHSCFSSAAPATPSDEDESLTNSLSPRLAQPPCSAPLHPSSTGTASPPKFANAGWFTAAPRADTDPDREPHSPTTTPNHPGSSRHAAAEISRAWWDQAGPGRAERQGPAAARASVHSGPGDRNGSTSMGLNVFTAAFDSGQAAISSGSSSSSLGVGLSIPGHSAVGIEPERWAGFGADQGMSADTTSLDADPAVAAGFLSPASPTPATGMAAAGSAACAGVVNPGTASHTLTHVATQTDSLALSLLPGAASMHRHSTSPGFSITATSAAPQQQQWQQQQQQQQPPDHADQARPPASKQPITHCPASGGTSPVQPHPQPCSRTSSDPGTHTLLQHLAPMPLPEPLQGDCDGSGSPGQAQMPHLSLFLRDFAATGTDSPPLISLAAPAQQPAPPPPSIQTPIPSPTPTQPRVGQPAHLPAGAPPCVQGAHSPRMRDAPTGDPVGTPRVGSPPAALQAADTPAGTSPETPVAASELLSTLTSTAAHVRALRKEALARLAATASQHRSRRHSTAGCPPSPPPPPPPPPLSEPHAGPQSTADPVLRLLEPGHAQEASACPLPPTTSALAGAESCDGDGGSGGNAAAGPGVEREGRGSGWVQEEGSSGGAGAGCGGSSGTETAGVLPQTCLLLDDQRIDEDPYYTQLEEGEPDRGFRVQGKERLLGLARSSGACSPAQAGKSDVGRLAVAPAFAPRGVSDAQWSTVDSDGDLLLVSEVQLQQQQQQQQEKEEEEEQQQLAQQHEQQQKEPQMQQKEPPLTPSSTQTFASPHVNEAVTGPPPTAGSGAGSPPDLRMQHTNASPHTADTPHTGFPHRVMSHTQHAPSSSTGSCSTHPSSRTDSSSCAPPQPVQHPSCSVSAAGTHPPGRSLSAGSGISEPGTPVPAGCVLVHPLLVSSSSSSLPHPDSTSQAAQSEASAGNGSVHGGGCKGRGRRYASTPGPQSGSSAQLGSCLPSVGSVAQGRQQQRYHPQAPANHGLPLASGSLGSGSICLTTPPTLRVNPPTAVPSGPEVAVAGASPPADPAPGEDGSWPSCVAPSPQPGTLSERHPGQRIPADPECVDHISSPPCSSLHRTLNAMLRQAPAFPPITPGRQHRHNQRRQQQQPPCGAFQPPSLPPQAGSTHSLARHPHQHGRSRQPSHADLAGKEGRGAPTREMEGVLQASDSRAAGAPRSAQLPAAGRVGTGREGGDDSRTKGGAVAEAAAPSSSRRAAANAELREVLLMTCQALQASRGGRGGQAWLGSDDGAADRGVRGMHVTGEDRSVMMEQSCVRQVPNAAPWQFPNSQLVPNYAPTVLPQSRGVACTTRLV